MNTTILRSNSYGPLAPKTLEDFEHELGVSLPEEYRTFLLQHNGGTPQPACFLAPDDPLEGDASPQSEREVVCFFALHNNAWSDSTMQGSLALPLQEAWRDLSAEQQESNLLPVGKDWSGNYICVGYQGQDRGRIFFYDHEYEVATPLAESFQAFLAALQTCEQHDE